MHFHGTCFDLLVALQEVGDVYRQMTTTYPLSSTLSSQKLRKQFNGLRRTGSACSEASTLDCTPPQPKYPQQFAHPKKSPFPTAAPPKQKWQSVSTACGRQRHATASVNRLLNSSAIANSSYVFKGAGIESSTLNERLYTKSPIQTFPTKANNSTQMDFSIRSPDSCQSILRKAPLPPFSAAGGYRRNDEATLGIGHRPIHRKMNCEEVPLRFHRDYVVGDDGRCQSVAARNAGSAHISLNDVTKFDAFECGAGRGKSPGVHKRCANLDNVSCHTNWPLYYLSHIYHLWIEFKMVFWSFLCL